MKYKLLLLLLVCLLGNGLVAQTIEQHLQRIVDSIYQEKPLSVGIIVHVESPNKHLSWDYATGYCNRETKEKLSFDQPVLLASNTKTFVSATILKLVEMKKIQLDQPIEKVIHSETEKWMTAAGYNTREIKIRNLLSHSSGIADYANEEYFNFVNTHPKYHWTRDEQIQLAMKVSKPLAMPGDTFKYADVNYLLLTEIIEGFTKKPFYESIRELLDFKKHNLNTTWFIGLEKTPAHAKPQAHQYWSKYPWDSYNIDPSWDLYGGGGMVSTMRDLALFYQQLFEGKMVHDPKVLEQIHTPVMPKEKTNYCLGIRVISMEGHTGYYHGGFWGTDVIYIPDMNTSISITILEKSERDLSATICKAMVNALQAKN